MEADNADFLSKTEELNEASDTWHRAPRTRKFTAG